MTIIGVYYALPFEEIIQKPKVYALVAEGMMQGKEVILLNDMSFTRSGRVNGYVRLNGEWVLRKKDYPSHILNYSGDVMKPKFVYPAHQTSTSLLQLVAQEGAVWPQHAVTQQSVVQALSEHTLLLKTNHPHEEDVIVIQKQDDNYLVNSAQGEQVVTAQELMPLLQLAQDSDYFVQNIPGTVVPTHFNVSLIKTQGEWEVAVTHSYLINTDMRVETSSVLEQINAEKATFLHYYLLQLAKDTAVKLEERLAQSLTEVAFAFLLDNNYKFWLMDSKLSTISQTDAVSYAKERLATLH